MEKSLLDILDREHGLVHDINRLDANIELISSRRIKLLMTLECEVDYERDYLAHLQSEIDRMNAEKSKLQNELVESRRALKRYCKRYILD